MKLTLVLCCCLAISQAADVKSSSGSTQKQAEEAKTEKRALDEGNAALQKRAPINVSPAPAPGIEYAEDNTPQVAEKSPSQQIYATPVPQLAKISDVLSGHHGVPFPTAIAGHLFSPVSVYQQRLGSPATYTVSQPIPSQLAYSEHKVYQPPQQNSVQYYSAAQKLEMLSSYQKQSKGDQLSRLVYKQPAPPQLFFQPQQIVYSQQQTQSPLPQTFAQQTPPQLYTQQQNQAPHPQAIFQYQFPAPAPVAYNQLQNQQTLQPLLYQTAPAQGAVTFTQSQVQQPGYSQHAEPQQLLRLLPQPIQYARQQQTSLNYQQQPQPHQTYQSPQASQNYQQQAPQQNYQQQAPQQKYQQPQQVPVNVQVQQLHYQAQQHQVPVQRELKTVQAPTKILEKQVVSPQPNYNGKQTEGAVSYASFSQSQPTPNVVPQPNYNQHQQTNQPKDLKPQQQQILYVKNQIAPENFQQQIPPYHQVYNQGVLLQNSGIPVQSQGFHGYVQQPLAAAPTFSPVQYFGKFAQSIFGYPQQQ